MGKYDVIRLMDILGTAAFAVSGVFAAMAKKLDPFGILIIAFVTAVGGGTLRDIMIGDTPVNWMRTMDYVVVVVASTALAVLFKGRMQNLKMTLLVFDSIGLGFFTILGLQKGLAFGMHPGICVALGTITGCFGGIIRDISLNNIPLIFEKEIYATACIVGGTVYILLFQTSLNVSVTEAISVTLVVVLRLLAVQFNWRLPSVYRKNDR